MLENRKKNAYVVEEEPKTKKKRKSLNSKK